MDINGLGSSVFSATTNNRFSTPSATTENKASLPSANETASQLFANPNSSDEVSISPQAQIIQQTNKNSNEASSLANEEGGQSASQNTASIRVTSSLGKTASSYGLNEQQAIDLYKKIDELL